jgi:prepilin-type N-terminal cleavage/methylation domain-containing protein
MHKKGFTLIELLIVVAIIAILAAIALPNFLEAQTRSKISRVKADLRSVNLALASYQLDNNNYPCSTQPSGTVRYSFDLGYFDIQPVNSTTVGSLFPMNNLAARPYISLTTPISYLSSFPNDPFNVLAMKNDNKIYVGSCSTWFTVASMKGTPWPNMNQYWELWPGGQFWWIMCSAGPDGRWDTTQNIATFLYDPTNGTVSRGDIYYYSHTGFDVKGR